MKQRFNWEIWRDRFIRGGDDVTLKSLSDGLDAPKYDTLQRRATREKWKEQREEYRRKTTVKTREKITDDLAAIKAQHVDTGRALMGIGLQVISTLRAKDFEDLKPRDALNFIALGTDIQRRALGMETLNLNLKSINVAELSDDELAELRARIARLRAGLSDPDKPTFN